VKDKDPSSYTGVRDVPAVRNAFVTGALRNATIAAIPASFYLAATFITRVIVGWCENTDVARCMDGYNSQAALRAIFVELAPMLVVSWGALLVGLLPFRRLRLATASALKLGAVASISTILSLPLVGSIALVFLPAVAFAWSYWVSQQPSTSPERSRDA
jgi:hypothetical protein